MTYQAGAIDNYAEAYALTRDRAGWRPRRPCAASSIIS